MENMGLVGSIMPRTKEDKNMKLHNYYKKDCCEIEYSSDMNRYEIVLYSDFTLEHAAKEAMEAARKCGAAAVKPYINGEEMHIFEANIYKNVVP
jgi:hypothetical protein